MYQGKSTKGNRKGKGKRRKANGKGKIIIAILLCMLIYTVGKGNQAKPIGYTYDSGTSVWAIAKRHCPDNMDIRTLVREIEEINGIENHTVYKDVSYKIPVYEKAR